jgi:hypothetical protein
MCLQICNKKLIVCKAGKVFMRKVTKLTEFVSKSNKGWGERDYLCIRKGKKPDKPPKPPPDLPEGRRR